MNFLISSTKKINTSAHRIYICSSKNIAKSEGLSKEEIKYVKAQIDAGFELVELNNLLHRIWIACPKNEKDANRYRENLRSSGASMFDTLKKNKIFDFQLINNGLNEEEAQAFLEGLLLASYSFKKYLSAKDKGEFKGKISLIGLANFKEVQLLSEAVFFSRNLVNEPFNKMGVAEFVAASKKMAQDSGLKCEVLNKKKIEALKMGGLIAVNQASSKEPAFLILEYIPKKASNKKPVVLVGKGVVYDTGGASLKPSSGMETMKCDMAGAAAVVGSLKALADNQIPVHVIGLLPLTDNAIGNMAIVPGDVITMGNGKSVEVLNTDAEGRLILADALHYAQKYQPELVIDLATLTGASVRAISDLAIAAMQVNADKMQQNLQSAADHSFERLVWFPMWSEYGDMIKSDIADIKNLGGPEAGQITAAKFLEHFTDYPWIHLDIAGPAFLNRNSAYRTKGATGVGVRLLYHFIKNYK